MTETACETALNTANGSAVTVELDVLNTDGADLDLQPDEVVRTLPDTGTELDVGTATTIELEVNPDTEAMPFLPGTDG